MRLEEITIAIFEKYSPDELATTAAAMAQAQSDLEGVEAEKKMSDSVYKERINKHAAEVSELAKKYVKGGETAQIGCKIRYDIPAPGQKSYIRFDTEETVEVHDMTTEEKQETFQFPLTAAAAEQQPTPAGEEPTAEIPIPPTPPTQPPPTEITFKDIQAIAAHVAQLQNGNRAAAVAEMRKSIASKLLVRGKVIGPDGRLEDVQSAEIADKLAAAWLQLAMDEATKPPAAEEVTRLCTYPGCILFYGHDGNHEFPKAAAPATDALATSATPQPKPEREKKLTRKKKGFAPPPDDEPPIQPGAPA